MANIRFIYPTVSQTTGLCSPVDPDWSMVGHETNKEITDEENVLSPMESETESIFSWAGECASAPIKDQAKGNASPPEWSQSDESQQTLQKAALQHSKKEAGWVKPNLG